MQNLKPKNNNVHIDFETRATVDLLTAGTVRYATDKNTIVLTAAITWQGKNYLFNPASNRKHIRKLIEKIYNSNAQIVAYNWQFEYYIIKYVCTRLYNWPEFPAERFICTMAAALNYGLPGKLASDTEFLHTAPKDTDGHAVMLRLTKPYKPGVKQKANHPDWRLWWDNDPIKHEKNQIYCIQDVWAETELQASIPALSKRENKIFRIDQQINTRGIHVDTKLCKGALKIFDVYKVELLKRIPHKSWKHFNSIGQREIVRQYVLSLSKTIDLPNMQGDTIDRVLRTCTNKTARKVLTAYRQTGSTALAKYQKVLDQQYDGVLYGNLQYCGASGTKRWAGRGVQLHNINRPVVDYDIKTVEIIQSGNYKKLVRHAQTIKDYKGNIPTVSDILKSYMRSFIVPLKGTYLSVNDYKAVEARLVFWFSNCHKGLKLFRTGGDPYIKQAAIIYDIKEKKVNSFPQRFVGKQNILGCGYGMGPPRFKDQCAEFDVHIGKGLAYKAVNAYRNKYFEVVEYWRELENTIKFLLRHNMQNKWTKCKRVEFMYDGTNILLCMPSGAILYYHKMHLNDGNLYYYTTPTQGARKMVIRSTWGGTILQNMCECAGRELMADGMIRLEAAEFPVLLTIHDELITGIGHKDCHQEVQACILARNKWCKSFPLEIEGQILNRYRKI